MMERLPNFCGTSNGVETCPIRKPICYIFGYGSLLSCKSRARTCPSSLPQGLDAAEIVAAEEFERYPSLIPVRVHGICRSWGFRVANKRPYTAVSVHKDESSFCCGVLFPMYCEKDVECLNIREEGYTKHLLSHEDIEIWCDNLNIEREILVRSLSREEDAIALQREREAYTKLFTKQTSSLEKLKRLRVPTDCEIYVYLVEDLVPPDRQHPMVQSYMDVCLMGCLELHLNFAREFILSTWVHPSLIKETKALAEENRDKRLLAKYESFEPWYDDRSFKFPFRHAENRVVAGVDGNSPIARPVTPPQQLRSRTASEELLFSSFQLIDSLLATCIPTHFSKRQEGSTNLDHR